MKDYEKAIEKITDHNRLFSTYSKKENIHPQHISGMEAKF